MPKYNNIIINNKNVGNLNKKTVQIAREDEKNITPDEVKTMFNDLKENLDKKNQDYQIYVKGLSPAGWKTLSSNNALTIKNYDEYLSARVNNIDKFLEFSVIQITVIKMGNMFNKKNP